MSESIIERICRLIEEKDLKDKDFCSSIDISQSTFSTWKTLNRDPKAKHIPLIADVLGVSQQYLMTGEDHPIGSETSITDEFSELDSVYLSLAKEARDNEIDPEDIRMAIQMFKEMKERNQNRDKKR